MAEGLITIAEKYLKKGAKVYVQGKLETRKWSDKDGHDQYTTEIVLRPYSGELLMLDSRKGEPDETVLAVELEERVAAA